MKTATLILNRNLPDITDALYEHLNKYDPETDIFVIEAGSDEDKLSRYTTWHATWEEAKEKGLRYNRGMNYGLSNMWKDGTFSKYDAFFLLTNDTELKKQPTLEPLCDILERHPAVGILSPCSPSWGEFRLLEHRRIAYFWYIMNNAYLLRREFIECICNKDMPDSTHFLFDGTNFRGYGTESELIAKAYMNNYAAAITRDVLSSENESHLLKHADLIKTEDFKENQKLYLEEGKRWMQHKYGFSSRWMMQEYVFHFYEKFFEFNPEWTSFKL